MTTHEIARKLLEGPDCPALFFAGDDGFGIIDEVKPAYISFDAEGVAVKEYYFQPRAGLQRAVEFESSIFQSGSQEQVDMGVMKRLHTELNSGNGRTLSRFTSSERAGWNALIAGDAATTYAAKAKAAAAVAAKAPDDALESIGLELRYTGSKPTITGQYLIVDTITESRRFATVPQDVGAQRMVRVEGAQMCKLEEFLKPSQRWFLVPRLNQDDITLVRDLPC